MTATSRTGPRPAHAAGSFRPAVTRLEDRLTPALAFQFDYSLDTSGLFADPQARAALERAGADLAAQIASTPSAIAPGGGLSWQAIFASPSQPGQQVVRDNLAVPQGTMLVYVGGMNSPGAEAAVGGPGGYSVAGTSAWQTVVTTRGLTGFSSWGGSISFDTSQNYYFGADAAGLTVNRLDFYSLATHELSHVLGFGTSRQWQGYVQNGRFTGPASVATYGAAVPLSADGEHLAQGTVSGGQPVSLQPVMTSGRRVGLSPLDRAILQDLGWQVTAARPTVPPPAPAPVPPVVPPPAASPPVAAPQPAPVTPAAPKPVVATPVAPVLDPSATPIPAGVAVTVVSGATDGTAQAYTVGGAGQLTPVGPVLRPFGGFTGAVRAVAADVNGDGTQDIVLGTGPGGGSQIRVLDGKTFTDLTVPFSAFEGSFAGGVFLAAGDFDKDGRADVVVTPDQGGGGRVRVLRLAGDQVATVADFFGIDDPTFRGGARAAVGDLNRDGAADLVISAGFGGGPRVAVFDGASVPGTAAKRKLVGDFFAFEQGLRNGAYVSVGDVNADGWGDVVFGAGPGGGPRVLTLDGRTLLTGGPDAALDRPLGDTFAGDPADRGGVRVAAKDLTAGAADVVVAGSGTGSELRVYTTGPAGQSLSATLAPLAGQETDGVYVG